LALKAKMQASERMASVGTLAAGVAHEINTPLAFVLMSLEMMQRELTGLTSENLEAFRQNLQEVVKKSERGLFRVRDIVRALSMFARKEPDQVGPLQIKDVTESALELVRNEIRHSARLQVKYEVAPSVVANEGRLCQVILNLLMNACQAIGTGAADRNAIEIRSFTG